MTTTDKPAWFNQFEQPAQHAELHERIDELGEDIRGTIIVTELREIKERLPQ